MRTREKRVYAVWVALYEERVGERLWGVTISSMMPSKSISSKSSAISIFLANEQTENISEIKL
jgi:hypothetical protein